MAKKSKQRKPRKPSFRFTNDDRYRIEEHLRPAIRQMFVRSRNHESMVRGEISTGANRVLTYLGNDWRLMDEHDERHPVVFPLRTDVDIRRVRRAVNILFPDAAITLKENIVARIARGKAEKRKWMRHGERFVRMHLGRGGIIRTLWGMFGTGHIAGMTLFRILGFDPQSRERWERNLHRSRLKVDDLRVTPACAAKVISELLHAECRVPRKYIDEEMLEKRFKEMPRP